MLRRKLAPLVGKNGSKKHGLSKMPEFQIWTGMKARCADKSNKYYGSRGVEVCHRWKDDFLAFISDMGLRPSPEHTIERKDSAGNYEPNNCVWATAQAQALNRLDRKKPRYTSSNPRIVVVNGVERDLPSVCKEFNVRQSIVNQRLENGWTIERALTTPIRGKSKAVSITDTSKDEDESVFKPPKTWRRACSTKPW